MRGAFSAATNVNVHVIFDIGQALPTVSTFDLGRLERCVHPDLFKMRAQRKLRVSHVLSMCKFCTYVSASVDDQQEVLVNSTRKVFSSIVASCNASNP